MANFNRVEITRVPKSEVHKGFSLLVFSLGSPAMPQEILVQTFILFLGLENQDFWAAPCSCAQMLLKSEVHESFSLLEFSVGSPAINL